jgi:hypothetical protein
MGSMRCLFAIFSLAFVLTSNLGFSKENPKTLVKPEIKIISVRGQITDLSQAGKTLPWNLKSRIADRLVLSLGKGAETKIQLHPHIVLTAFENTEFEIPVISWETRQFKEIKLTQGLLRLEVDDVPFDFQLLTPFFEFRPPPGMWVVNIAPDRALADILSFKGDLEVTSLNSEDKVNLHSGQKVTFRGIIEEGEIAYDLLLKGRKIPKGHWLAVEKLSVTDQKNYSLAAEKKRFELENQAHLKAARAEQKRQSNSTCQKPAGDFGDCQWKKEAEGCIRTRCTADGLWKDRQVVGASLCDPKGKSQIHKCDY